MENASIFLFFALCPLPQATSVSPFLLRYDELNYSPLKTATRLNRQPFHAPFTPPLILTFHAYERPFTLNLCQDASHGQREEVRVELDGRDVTEDSDVSHQMHHGFVEGDPNSSVTGFVVNGFFEGRILLSNGDSFHIEAASRFANSSDLPFHSFIYRDDDILPPGSSFENSSFDLAPPLFSAEAESINQNPSRSRRASVPLHSGRVCTVHAVVDSELFEHFRKEGKQSSDKETTQVIRRMLASNFRTVNEIYAAQDFNGINGIKFQLSRVSIFTKNSCDQTPPHPLCVHNVDVNSFLQIASEADESRFCLAYTFTFRDFAGTLGLANVAASSREGNRVGGICCGYFTVFTGGSHTKLKSGNTGVVTFLNNGQPIVASSMALTLAHEFGHSLGSSHDTVDPRRAQLMCTPGGAKGNYLMFPSASQGNKRHNKKFSQCSRDNISAVLTDLLALPPVDISTDWASATQTKRNCFLETYRSHCGNSVVEDTEKCDCGQTQEECKANNDLCCNPGNSNHTLGLGCTLKTKKGVRCSPSEGPCCDGASCDFHGRKQVCLEADNCKTTSFCNGNSSQCPEPKAADNGTPCEHSSKVCQDGACSGSICESLGLRDCLLKERDAHARCFLACLKDGKCISTRNLYLFRANRTKFVQEKRLGQRGILMSPGSDCVAVNGPGKCDLLFRCRRFDPEGAISRLSQMFAREKLAEYGRGARELWWVFLLCGVFVLLLLLMLDKCCAFYTPSHNPKQPKTRSIRSLIGSFSDRSLRPSVQSSALSMNRKGSSMTASSHHQS